LTILPMILTGAAGVLLGIVLVRLFQRPVAPSVAPSVDPSENATAKQQAAVPLRKEIPSRTKLMFGGAGALIVVAIGLLILRPQPTGQPQGVAGLDSATTASASAGAAAAKLDDVDTMISRLEARLKTNPSDGEGFRTLGWSFLNTGKASEAVMAYARATTLLPGRADVHAGYGEALIAAGNDIVSPEAKAQIDAALAIDPKEPRARFFATLYKAQNGQERAALDEWILLANSAPADLPWQTDLRQRIEKLGIKLGVPTAGRIKSAPASPVSAGPNAAALSSGAQLPPSDQQKMIDGMVAGLASRLQTSPDDVDGWVKLIRSRVVLKDIAKAKDDLLVARRALANAPVKLQQLNAVAAELKL
jgi:cytochrome c-type biogenesis protein CcmH